MTRVSLNASTLAQMPALTGVIEVTDSKGQTLGYFHAVSSVAGESPRSPLTREQLEKRRNEGHGRPLAEVIEELRGS